MNNKKMINEWTILTMTSGLFVGKISSIGLGSSPKIARRRRVTKLWKDLSR